MIWSGRGLQTQPPPEVPASLKPKRNDLQPERYAIATQEIWPETNQLRTYPLPTTILVLESWYQVPDPGTGYWWNVKRILLVCADPAMTEELTFFLQHSGFHVASAGESRQVIDEMERTDPDLILMREKNSRLNGDELCVRIRELSDIPIIVLGWGPEEEAGVEILEMGADAYLPSPLDSRELLARIRSLLRRRRTPNPGVREDSHC